MNTLEKFCPRTDFWSYLHHARRFSWPIVIRAAGQSDHVAEAFNIVVKQGGELEYSAPDWYRGQVPAGGWWDWNSLAGRFGLNSGNDAAERLKKLVNAYLEHLGEKQNAKYIYEFTMLFGASGRDAHVEYTSAGSLSVAASEPLTYEWWEHFVYSELKSIYHSVIASAYLERTRMHSSWSARAAIMSRNLSHNVGSHTLANSRFFESVGVFEFLDENQDDSKSYEAPDRPLSTGSVRSAKDRLSRFHGFLQGRLDFIARALGESQSTAEPMFFFGDVVQGFLSQEVLLNTLISDNGITIKDIEFRIRLPGMPGDAIYEGSEETEVETRLRKYRFDSKEGSTPIRDLLVAIPGGMVGRHAFYAFLENVMRNAAKYGRKSENGRFVIRMEVKAGKADKAYKCDSNCDQAEHCYFLEVADSRSMDDDGNVALTVRRFLNDSIIKYDGRSQTEGHGIQEMKVCANFLAGEQLAFPSDDNAEGRVSDVTKELGGYAVYLAGPSVKEKLQKPTSPGEPERVAWIMRSDNALQAWSQPLDINLVPTEAGRGGQHLIYRLILQRAIIFGIVENTTGAAQLADLPPIRIAKDNDAVAFYKDIRTLAENPAHYGLVVAEDLTGLDALLNKIAKYHYALPYRLMIVCPTKELAESAREMIIVRTAGSASCSVDLIPVRRVFAITCPELFDDKQRAIKPEAFPSFAAPQGDQGSESPDWRGLALFKAVAEGWLRAWKGSELEDLTSAELGQSGQLTGWHLYIGFDRQGAEGRALDRWKDLGKRFRSQIVKVRVAVASGEWFESNGGTDHPVEKAQLIVYDNHGKVFGEFADSMNISSELVGEPKGGLGGAQACYHSFSGSAQVELCHSLETPPDDPFGLAFLVYSLVEASLLSVAVLDERVAEAMIENGNKLFGKRHRALMLCRVYPLFQVRFSGSESIKRYLSPSIEGAIVHVSKSGNGVSGSGARANDSIGEHGGNMDSDEGLHLRSDGGRGKARIVRIAPWVLKEEATRKNDRSLSLLGAHGAGRHRDLDMLVVHEGVIDRLAEWWDADTADSFGCCVPSLVRTSGRGAKSRHGGDHLPFLEFSELSRSTYQYLNKYAIGRALLGLRGQPK